MTKTTATFSIDAKRFTVNFEIDRGCISFTGIAGDGSSGQICDQLADAYADLDSPVDEIQIIISLWNRWHLKAIEPFNAAQESDIALARHSLIILDQESYPEQEGYTADEIADAEFNHNDDIIDSRAIIDRIEYLKVALADIVTISTSEYIGDDDPRGNREDYLKELEVLEELETRGSQYAPDWRYGETMIHESYFTTYIEEQTKEIGDLPDKIPSYLVIDWEATANNCRVDYTEIDFDGETYLIR